MANHARTVLDIHVNNHPGVMAHVTGLFSRRAFNVEAILCLPVEDSTTSRIWLLVNEDGRLDQMMRQMRKLQDVYEVNAIAEYTKVFSDLASVMSTESNQVVTE
ncbi:acetolactate synthase small subunit [Halodesulfovibrio marinisediminis]|uniref:Acetolactate synthase small subunit n=1 Tax=Halodesulfovibrio marinisediminis DSM 17456 TaxID=1121457 RepID=A0A1N6DRN7_9BACT|nr:acetolactate synthase small subunit [Halodesulfovibrio marinisediminis]SIN73410.1 acetolactate synthase, small subunit [Halodesulfovibrio marinisediminis DSM 17456]